MKFTYSEFEIMDAHAHIFPEKISEKASVNIGNFYDIKMANIGSSEMLLNSGKQIDVRKYLVCSVATVPAQTKSINDFLKSECEKHSEFMGFGALHPDFEDIEGETERIISLGFKGIKLHPDFQKFDIDDRKAYKIYECAEGRLPILFHMGDNRYTYSQPKRLAKIMEDFPKLKVLAAHFGGYRAWEEAYNVLKGDNFMVDTSSSLPMISVEYARELVGHYGAERCFFGSDFPMWNHTDELERFFAMELSYEDNKKILADNFKRFFNL